MNEYEDFLRSDINRTVRRYCFQNHVPQADVWRELRGRLMVKTGFVVPRRIAKSGIMRKLALEWENQQGKSRRGGKCQLACWDRW